MKLCSLPLVAAAVVLAALLPAHPTLAAKEEPEYACLTDADCADKFPDIEAVCIVVDNYGETIRKCTPNTAERPACRGGQPGLCPSYQDEQVGYLNVHCVFAAKDVSGEGATDDADAIGSGSDSAARRFLMFAADVEDALVDDGSAEAGGSSSSDTAAEDGDDDTSKPDTSATSTASYATVTIKKKKVTGEFICVDVSDCENQAYDSSTCFPKECGPKDSLTQCNNHGTCSYPSIQTMDKRRCTCYQGFTGDKCQQETSSKCDVDCGAGGDCVDGRCKCKAGYDGKEYKDKKGKPNQRCTKCTNDLGCQNGNPCDIETGTCSCMPGFKGPTCGATEDSCTTRDCGEGTCRPLDNGTAACYCPLCAPDCEICKKSDCSTCPSTASTLSVSKSVVFFTAVFVLVAGNLVL